MHILVPVKWVVDHNALIRVKPDGSGVDTANVKFSLNPFDENALEEALQMRERGVAESVVVVTIGPDKAVDGLRAALAMGADRAMHIRHEAALEPLLVARVLNAIVEREAPALVLMGKQAIDGDNNQSAQMLAGLLGWPQATFASKIELAEGRATVTREVDGGTEVLDLPLPAVISADLRLNTPRYASLPNIMKARKKLVETLDAAGLGLDLAAQTEILRTDPPPARQAGQIVATVDELIAAARRVRDGL